MSDSSIKVYVYKPSHSKSYYMKYRDPVSGKVTTRSTKQETRKLAIKAAGSWESELKEGRYKPPSRVTWEEFRRRYEDEVLNTLADGTYAKATALFNGIEELISPEKLASLDAAQITRLQRLWREKRKHSEQTIKGNLAYLKAAFNWAKRQGMLREVPVMEVAKRAKNAKMMRGRPITTEEFDRLISATPAVVGEAAAEVWQFLLRGLWASGLRLGEALNLYWDGDRGIRVDLQPGEFPLFIIPGEHQKSGNDELLPMAPEFFELLQTVPIEERTGRVFDIPRQSTNNISKTITDIGEQAKVKVDTKLSRKPGPDGKQYQRVKWASAHDLRRSFGERWAQKVMPQVLQRLMRHASINTTMEFYVGRDAKTASNVIWEAAGKSLPGGGKAKPSITLAPADLDAVQDADQITESGDCLGDSCLNHTGEQEA